MRIPIVQCYVPCTRGEPTRRIIVMRYDHNNNRVRCVLFSRTLCRLHNRAAGQLLLPQAGGGRVAFPQGLLAAADDDHGRVDHGPSGRARQHGRDAHQVPARPVPVLLSRLRTGADGVDTQERGRPVRPRLLRHIVLETVFPGHPEVNLRARVAAKRFLPRGGSFRSGGTNYPKSRTRYYPSQNVYGHPITSI